MVPPEYVGSFDDFLAEQHIEHTAIIEDVQRWTFYNTLFLKMKTKAEACGSN